MPPERGNSMTPERARILAAYAKERRGWDEAGSMKQLEKVKHIDPDRTALAWIRFCADPKAATPGAFPNTSGPHWHERIRQGAEAIPHPPRSSEACDTCGRHERSCLCENPTLRPPVRVPPTEVWKQAKAELMKQPTTEGTSDE